MNSASAPGLPRTLARGAGVIVCLLLLVFYITAASEHGRRVNLSKARADQSGYLLDAEYVYANWHGQTPPLPIGFRNRMPIYAGYLAVFYHPGLTDPEFFEVGKVLNIYLSVALLAVLAVVVRRELPPHVAINLMGIVTFGYFIYKAAYTQSELLFYFFFFLAFLGCWHLSRMRGSTRTLGLAALTGGLAGLAYLTKAAVPLLVGVFLAIFMAQPVVALLRSTVNREAAWRTLAWRTAAALIFGMTYLAVLSPYLATNKRLFGRYFYNVNSTFYVWYDDWPAASVGVRLHHDDEGLPDVPESEIPTLRRYLKSHTFAQIAQRIGSGLADMAITAYRTYDFLPYVILYLGMLAVLAVRRSEALRAMLREHRWMVVFLACYAGVYVVATAFYFPISGTGTARFYMAHLLPFFFVMSRVLSSARFNLRAFHLATTVVLAFDIAFRTYPRLMTTYGGF